MLINKQIDDNLSKLIKFSRVNYKQQFLKKMKNYNFKHKIDSLSSQIKIKNNKSKNRENNLNNDNRLNSSCTDGCSHENHQNSHHQHQYSQYKHQYSQYQHQHSQD